MSSPPFPEDLDPLLERYHFYRHDWHGYDELVEDFRWDIPDPFNMATYLCARWAAVDPERPALIAVGPDGEPDRYSYGQLERWSNQLASHWQGEGLGRGDRIGVSGSQTVESLIAHLATWKRGGISVPLSLRTGEQDLCHRLAETGARACVVDPHTLRLLRPSRSQLPDLESVLTAGAQSQQDGESSFWSVLGEHDDSPPVEATSPEDPATILYTSGTTGPPKGVVHSHSTALGVLPAYVTTVLNMRNAPDDVLRSPVEWSWGGSLYNGLIPSLFFGKTVLGDADPQFNPRRELKLVDRFGITVIGAPPAVFEGILGATDALPAHDLSSLRVLLLGGDPSSGALYQGLGEVVPGAALHEGYGLTESSLAIGDCQALGVPHRPGKLGKPLPGRSVRLMGLEGGDSPDPGQPGEIAIRCDGDPNCFREYWNRPGATSQRKRDGWLHSGDVGSRDGSGYYTFHVRRAHLIVSCGRPINPVPLEDTLRDHPDVVDAGVAGVHDESRGEVPVAYVVPAPDANPSERLKTRLLQDLREEHPEENTPRRIEFLTDLPRTPGGTVRRQALCEQDTVDE